VSAGIEFAGEVGGTCQRSEVLSPKANSRRAGVVTKDWMSRFECRMRGLTIVMKSASSAENSAP